MAVSAPSVGQILGHYRIVEHVGAGGMGVVFRAHDERLDRDVALKILPALALLSEAARRQFRREALSLAKITDPFVAMAFDFGHDQGLDYLVTEFVPGLTLEAKLGGRPLRESDVLLLGKQMASGLEAAHRVGVIHRDLKPANIKVTPDGQLKILDFGLAYLLKTKTDGMVTAPLTDTYSDAGTLPYMAPEQIKGHKPDERTDVWSAGAVLYEMTTGKRPFGDLSGARLIAAILEQAPISPREVNPKISADLEHVILRALQKDPRERYQSAGDLRIDLANPGSGALPLHLGPQQKQNLPYWLIAAAVIAATLIIVYFWPKSTLPEERMMAVLPFESLANDAPGNALGLGLTETVTSKLVEAVDGGHLQIVSTRELVAEGVRTSDQARREFGTDLVLEGSLQQEGSRIRVTWGLVDPRTHSQIAANTITGSADDIFGLQDNLFSEVLERLPVAAGWKKKAASGPETAPAAYDYYLRGRGYLDDSQKADNIQSAIDQFQRAIAVDKNYAPAYAAMGLAYAAGVRWKNQGKDWIEKARARCEGAIAITPQLAEGHTCLGHVYYSTGHYDEAVQEFQRSLDLDHNSDETLRLLADSYEKQGKVSEAEQVYQKAVQIRSNYWRVYSAFGAFYFERGRYLDAERLFQQAIKLAPLNVRGYSNLGATYLYMGQYQAGVQALQQGIKLRPTYESYGNLGACLFYMRRYEEAARTLREAVKIDANDSLNWGNLGDTLYQIPARRQEARDAYRKAIVLAKARLEINPKDGFVLAFMADYHAMLDDEQQARNDLQRALEIAPADAEVLFRAAILYNHFADREKTLEFLEKSAAAGYSRTVIRDTPDFDWLRQEPRYRSLMPKS